EGSRIFLGAHDFRGFSRGEGGVCHIESVQFLDLGEWLALDIKADRFLWEMVRRIARGLELFSEGGISLRDLRDAMKGRDVGLEPAPPEYLW
ncbi:MAG: tRNA pseudouridine(38-40) synthase TruA, partial [Anaerolineae bacterium]|nr:tRNA pseudouridine(38-40) synthase TruA [Anaerolineae bacterium]